MYIFDDPFYWNYYSVNWAQIRPQGQLEESKRSRLHTRNFPKVQVCTVDVMLRAIQN